MRLVIPAIALALCATTPAFATGGFQCRPISGAGPVLTIPMGHHISATPFSVTLQEGMKTLSTDGPNAPILVSQSWVDERYLWLDLVDSNLMRREATLRATFQPKMKYRPAIGTLVRNGRSYKVRCIEA